MAKDPRHLKTIFLCSLSLIDCCIVTPCMLDRLVDTGKDVLRRKLEETPEMEGRFRRALTFLELTNVRSVARPTSQAEHFKPETLSRIQLWIFTNISLLFH